MDERIFRNLVKIRDEASRLFRWLPAIAWLFLFLVLTGLANVDLLQAVGLAGLVALLSSCLLAVLAFAGVIATSWNIEVTAGGQQFPPFKLGILASNLISAFLPHPCAPPRALLFA